MKKDRNKCGKKPGPGQPKVGASPTSTGKLDKDGFIIREGKEAKPTEKPREANNNNGSPH